MKGRPAAQAAAGIANCFPPEGLDALRVVMQNHPEESPRLMNVLHHLFAKRGHGLAKLYNAIAMADVQGFPSAQQLQYDLIDTCNINNVSNRDFLCEAIENLCCQFLGPSIALDKVSPDQLNQLATSSAVLMNALGQHTGNSGNTNLLPLKRQTLQKLDQLYTRAQTLNENLSIHFGNAPSLTKASLLRVNNLIDYVNNTPDFWRNHRSPWCDPNHSDHNLYKNYDVVSAIVRENGQLLEYTNDDCKNNADVVTAAVSEDGSALEYAGKNCIDNPKIVALAVRQYGLALEYAGENCKDDPEIVALAVTKEGSALRHAGNDCRNDPEIVALAVSKLGLALQYASDDRRNDPKIVALAVTNDGSALKHAGDDCRNDPEIVALAVQENSLAIKYAGPDAVNDKSVKAALAARRR